MTKKILEIMPELAIMRAIIAAEEPTEIERLQAENAKLRKAVEQNYSIKNLEIKNLRAEVERWNDLAQHNRDAADHLEAENERLREALEKAEAALKAKPAP